MDGLVAMFNQLGSILMAFGLVLTNRVTKVLRLVHGLLLIQNLKR